MDNDKLYVTITNNDGSSYCYEYIYTVVHKEKRYAVLSRIGELRIMEWHDTLENLADVPFELAEKIVGIFYKEFWN